MSSDEETAPKDKPTTRSEDHESTASGQCYETTTNKDNEPTSGQHHEPVLRKRLKLDVVKMKLDDSAKEKDSDETPQLDNAWIDDDDEDVDHVIRIRKKKRPQNRKHPCEMLLQEIPPVEIHSLCSQCTSNFPHFHRDNVDIRYAISFILLAKEDNVCKSVPANIKTSMCLLLDKSKLPDEDDCTCDEMPWIKQKGRICKQYVMQEKSSKPHKLWPRGKNAGELPPNCEVLNALKSMWDHSKVKSGKKKMVTIEGNPVVFIQYAGLSYQPELALGNRKIRPSTTKMIVKELKKAQNEKNAKSTKRVMENVIRQITLNDNELPLPSKIPSLRNVTWVKEKAKKPMRKKFSVNICHKMAEERNAFIKHHDISPDVVSVVLFNKAQLDDIKKFCCSEEFPCSALGIDATFQYGNCYVVTTSYRHPFLQRKEGTYPTLLGPLMVTHQLQRHNYRVLFDAMMQDAPELANNLKAFITDGEVALQQAASEAFPSAASLMCLTQVEKDIKHKIQTELALSLSFYHAVLEDMSGEQTDEGLIHAGTVEEYSTCLRKLQTKWNKLEKRERGHIDPQFYNYFMKNKAQIIYDHCRPKLSKDIHLIGETADSNTPEYLHDIMQRWQNGQRQDMTRFIEDMRELVNKQQNDVRYACNPGPYSLRHESVRPVQSDVTVSTRQEESPGTSALASKWQDRDEIKVGCLDALPYLTNVHRNLLIGRSKEVPFREGFRNENLIFPKLHTGAEEDCWVTSRSKGTFTCKCLTFKAYQICEHTLVHAWKEKELDNFITTVSHMQRDVEAVGHIVPTWENYDNQSTAPLQPTFTQFDEEDIPPKPSCPPTVGEPFLVKPVGGTNIQTCFGCSGTLRHTDMCVAHKQSYLFYNRQQRQWITCTGVKHFHVHVDCIKAGNNPGFDVSQLVYLDESMTNLNMFRLLSCDV